jgi:hypothetical protein
LICNSRNYHIFGNGYDYCSVSGKEHTFEWPNGSIKPTWNGQGDVVGCGLVLNPNNQLAIFFTGNGILMGQFVLREFRIIPGLLLLQASNWKSTLRPIT